MFKSDGDEKPQFWYSSDQNVLHRVLPAKAMLGTGYEVTEDSN